MTTTAPGASMAPAVWLLGLTQIVGYGTLYYSFGVLAPAMGRDLGWPQEWVFGALSVSLLLGGLVSPIAGRWADRFGAARLMVWGSLAAAASLAACASAPEGVTFVLGLTVMEIASAFVLYGTAFTALAQLHGRQAQRSIVYLTLIAGFASTVFWPLTSLLREYLTWREVYFLYAALNLIVCLPAHAWLAGHTRRRLATSRAAPEPAAPMFRRELRLPALLLMLAGFALFGFASSSLLMHMVPMLAALGLGGSAALVAALFGPAQVLSRLVNMQFGKDVSQPALAALAALMVPVAVATLVTTAPSAVGGVAFAVIFGLGSGLSSIVAGTLPLALFGSAGYGSQLGWIGLVRQLASAVAPVAFSIAVAAVATPLSLWLVVVIGVLGVVCFVAIWAIARPQVTSVAAA